MREPLPRKNDSKDAEVGGVVQYMRTNMIRLGHASVERLTILVNQWRPVIAFNRFCQTLSLQNSSASTCPSARQSTSPFPCVHPFARGFRPVAQTTCWPRKSGSRSTQWTSIVPRCPTNCVALTDSIDISSKEAGSNFFSCHCLKAFPAFTLKPS
jgi:hypothetical protein